MTPPMTMTAAVAVAAASVAVSAVVVAVMTTTLRRQLGLVLRSCGNENALPPTRELQSCAHTSLTTMRRRGGRQGMNTCLVLSIVTCIAINCYLHCYQLLLALLSIITCIAFTTQHSLFNSFFPYLTLLKQVESTPAEG
jgi:hypothetical protein